MVCKEVGGTMMPLWPMYMKDCAGLVYVVDASDSFQLGASAAALRHILSLPAIRGKPVLLALNKSDAPCVVPMEDVEATFDISSLREEIGDAMVVMKTSALSGANIDDVLSWVRGIYGL
jgi:signal recognition particle receptor subunit beta